jgi:hypothetical protein
MVEYFATRTIGGQRISVDLHDAFNRWFNHSSPLPESAFLQPDPGLPIVSAAITEETVMERKLNLAIILGSTREGRFCDNVVAWALRQISADERFALDVVDPLALDLPSQIEAQDGPAVKALAGRIAAADAFIVVTPEYNHGIPVL